MCVVFSWVAKDLFALFCQCNGENGVVVSLVKVDHLGDDVFVHDIHGDCVSSDTSPFPGESSYLGFDVSRPIASKALESFATISGRLLGKQG